MSTSDEFVMYMFVHEAVSRWEYWMHAFVMLVDVKHELMIKHESITAGSM